MPPPLTAGRVVARFAVGVTLLALVLFVPAGTWRWPAAWVFIGLYLALAFVPVGAFYALLALVLRENAFLSRVVEIHPEAGHHVITTGPYAVVRHPMYAGFVVWLLAAPVALGSLRALVPSALVVIGILVRTVLEDRALHAELPGYPEYAAKVRWRLLPYVF